MKTFDRQQTCAFSGHRILPTSFDVALEVRTEIKKAIERGKTHFLTGMAMGFDLLAAEEVLRLKEEGFPVTLEAVVPCVNQDRGFSSANKARYAAILRAADCITYTGEKYSPLCMQIRNQHLVDHASLLICFLTQSRGGTHATVKYAKTAKIEVINVAELRLI